MRKDTAELLTAEEGDLYEGYSGRGMYGEKTTGVTFASNADFQRALLVAAYELGSDGTGDVEAVLDDLGRLRSDSLGMDIIVY